MNERAEIERRGGGRRDRASGDAWRLVLANWVFGPLQGITLLDWLRLLATVKCRVAPRYALRAATTTVTGALNSANALVESALYRARVERTDVAAPVFILGHYRSGTTHLQNLLSVDDRFAHPNNYDANFPKTFLTTGKIGMRMGSVLAPRKRPFDDVKLGLEVPTEDELALASLCQLSPHMSWHFPRAAEHFDRYLDFDGVSDSEKSRWCEALLLYAKKLTLQQGKTLVFKSPCHTARIPLLLRCFPDARFVHIHRNPYDVYRSAIKMERSARPMFQFQVPVEGTIERALLERYRRMYAAYFATRDSIPAGRFAEVGFDALTGDPIGSLERIYETIGLPSFDAVRPRIEAYLASITGYRRNRYRELPEETRRQVASLWRDSFDAWGYAT